jgi:hypothetical protein
MPFSKVSRFTASHASGKSPVKLSNAEDHSEYEEILPTTLP